MSVFLFGNPVVSNLWTEGYGLEERGFGAGWSETEA